MGFAKGKPTDLKIKDILDLVSEFDILNYYLNIRNLPCFINSPLRIDNNPSFGLYSSDGISIKYKDLATKENGSLYTLLGKLWNKSFSEVLNKIFADIPNMESIKGDINTYKSDSKSTCIYNSSTELQCKVRKWQKHDAEYWNSYGITIEWLNFAEVYPISHKIIIKDSHKYVIGADKYAYVYVEHKEGKTTLKIYQPYNKKFKWSNKHDGSVISLWTKVPAEGDFLCVCASLKDALCLWANTGIPSIAVQGEGYNISNTAINVLKSRYKNIFIIFDNDKAGLEDGIKLSKQTGFTNIVLPQFEGGKDISDFYKSLEDKSIFKQTIFKLINYDKQKRALC